MPRPRSIDDETLLEAARDVFVEKGPGASTREVARRAGVSEGVLFQRYKTKADLFFAALAPPVADPGSILSDDAAAGDPALLEDAALRILAYFREAMPLLLPLVSHPEFDAKHFFGSEAPASLQGWIDALVQYLDRRRGAGAGDVDAHSGATLLTSSLFGIALIDTIGVHGAPMPDEAIRGMVRALWDGIAHDDAGTR